MADEATTTPAPKKKLKKTPLIVAGILIVEAIVIVGAMKVLSGPPASVSAVEIAADTPTSAEDKIVETLVLDAKMPNNKSGVTYIYAAEIYVQVKHKHLEKVKAEIEQFQNEIKADITAIWRTAEPQHFQEPRLENLTRKVYALLSERFGTEKTAANPAAAPQPIVHKVVIVMSTGFRVDS